MHIAIVGAGASGLGCGHTLAARGHRVVIFEQSNHCGGRAATLQLHACVVDHGAQYLRLPDDLPALHRLVLRDPTGEEPIDIARPVWPFDRENRVSPGEARQNAEPKWTFAGGLHVLGRSLATGLDVRLHTSVSRVERLPDGYRLLDTAGAEIGVADRVVVAIPAPLAMDLLPRGPACTERMDRALVLLETATYGPMLTFILGYRRPADGTVFAGGTASDPRPYYALVNTDREHDISWLAVENDKGPTRAPDDVLALVVQMAVPFSELYFDAPAQGLLVTVDQQVRTLLAVDLGKPLWHECVRWPSARPMHILDLAALNAAHDGLCFVGDYAAGWRLHLAMQAGIDVAPLVVGPLK